jgi:hypothetical protein
MASKFDGDVRPLSNNQAYMGVVFSGPLDEALAQAKAAPGHGLAEQYVPFGVSRDRAALLQHLNLLPPSQVVRKPRSYVERMQWSEVDTMYSPRAFL